MKPLLHYRESRQDIRIVPFTLPSCKPEKLKSEQPQKAYFGEIRGLLFLRGTRIEAGPERVDNLHPGLSWAWKHPALQPRSQDGPPSQQSSRASFSSTLGDRCATKRLCARRSCFVLLSSGCIWLLNQMRGAHSTLSELIVHSRRAG